ncbi:MAG: hypothetical protein M4D80_00045 [Myxococcota bacterium]|nr:hypothetical protein [Myxococcota bacterium]
MRMALLLVLQLVHTTMSIRLAHASCHKGNVIAAADQDLQVLAGVTCLDGTLELTKNVSQLGPLKELTELTGSLRVAGVERLSSLRGLDALTRIGGSVHIGGPKMGTPKLRDVDGLRSLVEIGGDLWISGGYIFEPGKSRMSPIHRVSGLVSLVRVGGTVHLSDLSGFSGLNSLVEIGGDLEISHSKFKVLAGFANLARIGGSLRFENNQKLARVDAAPKLAEIGGDVAVACLNEHDASASLRLTERTVRARFASITVMGTVWRVAQPSSPCWIP